MSLSRLWEFVKAVIRQEHDLENFAPSDIALRLSDRPRQCSRRCEVAAIADGRNAQQVVARVRQIPSAAADYHSFARTIDACRVAAGRHQCVVHRADLRAGDLTARRGSPELRLPTVQGSRATDQG